ncbi:MAG: ABC transporter substrate-binding protein [Burkholderiaceae bacterium]
MRRGQNNFDRIEVKIYKDATARLEALKAGEFDLMRFFSAGDWARRVNGKRFDTGELVKGEFAHKLPSGFQVTCSTPAGRSCRTCCACARGPGSGNRLREWMNRQLFYGLYQRVHGLFGNTACETHGSPSAEELALMEPWRKSIPAAAFGSMPQPPRTDGDHSLRGNLRSAKALLNAAGWAVKDGVLRNAQGEALVLEYMDSNEGGVRTVSPWMRNLEKLGVTLKFRSVDFALYQERLQKFDFDITSINFPGTNNPGQEFADLFGSKAADTPDSGNLSGVKSPAVDAMIRAMTRAKTQEQLLPACHALERIIVSSHYLIPQWAAGTHRMAYNAWRLVRPAVLPPYSPGETWVINTWWAKLPAPTLPTAH